MADPRSPTRATSDGWLVRSRPCGPYIASGRGRGDQGGRGTRRLAAPPRSGPTRYSIRQLLLSGRRSPHGRLIWRLRMDIGTGITDAGRCSQILLATGSVARATTSDRCRLPLVYAGHERGLCTTQARFHPHQKSEKTKRDFTLTKKQSEISTHTELEMPFFLGKFIVNKA
jgi:hypothetical protein